MKIDIEGYEREGLPAWLNEGALNNVRQLIIEFHTNWNVLKDFAKITLQLIHNGLLPISHEANTAYGRHDGIYFMEMLFRRTNYCTNY